MTDIISPTSLLATTPPQLDEIEMEKFVESLPVQKLTTQSPDFVSGTRGWKLGKDGLVEIGGLSFNKNFITTAFDTFDGWSNAVTGSASITASIGGGKLVTGTTANSTATANAEGVGSLVDFLKNPIFECILTCTSNANQLGYVGVGDLSIGDGTEEGFGFRVSNSVLYAISTYSDGVTSASTNTELTGITVTNTNLLRAVMDSSEGKIYYYVNGKLKATHTDSATRPDGTVPVAMTFYIKNVAVSTSKAIYPHRAFVMWDF